MKLLTLTDRLWGLGMTSAVYGAIVPAMLMLSAGTGKAPAAPSALKTFDVTVPRPVVEPLRRPAARSPRAATAPAAVDPPPRAAAPADRGGMVPTAMVPASAVAELGSAAPAPVSSPVPPAESTLRGAPDPAILREYATRLWAHIAAKRPAGIDLAGEVLIAFTVERSGRLESLTIARSSGNPLLDRLALRSARRAAPLPAPPATLSDDQLRFTIAFSFR